MNTSTGGGAVCWGWQRGRGFGAVTGRGGGAGCTAVNRRHGLGVQVNVEKGWERPSVAELAGGACPGKQGTAARVRHRAGPAPVEDAWTASELKVQRLLECLFTGNTRRRECLRVGDCSSRGAGLGDLEHSQPVHSAKGEKPVWERT